MVSPGRNVGMSARFFFCIYLLNKAFCMANFLTLYLTVAGTIFSILPSPGRRRSSLPPPALCLRLAGPRPQTPNQIRPQTSGLGQGRPAPEAANFLVIAVQQDFRSFPTPKLDRKSVG